MSKAKLWDPNFCKGAPLVVGQLAENQRRWVAGLLAQALGNVKAVAELLDMDRKTVLRGRTEVEAGVHGLGRVRRSGAGGKPAEERDPTVEKELCTPTIKCCNPEFKSPVNPAPAPTRTSKRKRFVAQALRFSPESASLTNPPNKLRRFAL